jgi:hypothetical protein
MRLLALAAALFFSGCSMFSIDFGRKITEEENILRADIRAYYDEAAAAFAAGNADLLSELYDPAIGRPMTREQIHAWGVDFFKKYGPARFKVEKIDFERVGHVSAVVVLTYRVETRDGAGSFHGTERDELVKHGRHWAVAAWDKVP